jgi:hypothetical protein
MARLSSFLAKGQEKAEAFVLQAVDTWVSEGRLAEQRAQAVRQSLNAPEVEAGLFHLGAHFAISLPLRFPFGALARFFYTLGLRLKAEFLALIGRGGATQARRSHTLLVMLVALLPGFGRLAYFFSPALSGERLLLILPLDQVSQKLPFKTYRRLHLAALFDYWAQGDGPGRGLRRLIFGGWISDLRERLGALREYRHLIVAVLAVDIVALTIGTGLYVASGSTSVWWFNERSVMATLDVAQLLVASLCGIAAYQVFWRQPDGKGVKEAAGIFLWGIGGVGLIVFAADDYFTVHETLGHNFEGALTLLPFDLNMPDDFLVLGYAVVAVVVLFVFRMEVIANRPSATLLQLAAVASIVMVFADIFADPIALRALEFPAQTLANGLLMLAFYVRYREVASQTSEATVAECFGAAAQ